MHHDPTYRDARMDTQVFAGNRSNTEPIMKLTYALAIAMLAAAALGAPAVIRAQIQPPMVVNPVCREACPDALRDPAGAAACAAREQVCTTKINLYEAYMLQLDAGTTKHALPAIYVELLQPFYSGADLRQFRFAFADRQPSNNATTDCSIAYFNNQSMVNDIRSAQVSSDTWLRWLFHELRHYGQCRQLGSRHAYAKMWFGHLDLAFIRTNSADMRTLHGAMIMENEAASRAARVLQDTRHLRDRAGRLVRPIQATLVAATTAPDGSAVAMVGAPQRISAQITGGSDPLQLTWRWRQPGETTFRSASALLVGNRAIEFTPGRAGTYLIEVVVSQDGSGLRPATATLNVQANQPPTLVSHEVVSSPTPVAGRPIQLRGSLAVRILSGSPGTRARPQSGVTVSLGSSARPAELGTRSTDATGWASFQGVPMTSASVLVTAARAACRARTAEHRWQTAADTLQLTIVCS